MRRSVGHRADFLSVNEPVGMMGFAVGTKLAFSAELLCYVISMPACLENTDGQTLKLKSGNLKRRSRLRPDSRRPFRKKYS